MKYIVYFHSRKNLHDTSTWGKELMPEDATISEIKRAAMLAGCEGFGILESDTKIITNLQWFVK